MTRAEYIQHLTIVYLQANNADQTDAEAWQDARHTATHCNAVESIMRDMLTPCEYQLWLDTLESAAVGDFRGWGDLANV